jgi:hypothetical protein
MTDQPIDATEHPDEGLIHAWLDGALSAAEAERLAAHVRICADCEARVAEARGLIAGASRIVAALDGAPAGARPSWAQGAIPGGQVSDAAAGAASEAPTGASVWRWLRVTPGRAALAATILVAIGITLTYDRAAMDSTPRSAVSVVNPQRTDVPAATSPEGAASGAAKPRDPLLDSAVAKNVTIAQGQRTMEAARGPSLPSAPPPSTTLQAPKGTAGEAVALGRAADEARRESPGVAADRSRAGVTGGVASTQDVTSATATVMEPQPAPASVAPAPVQRPATAGGAMMAKTSGNTAARSCLMLESPDADARWADQPFPLVLAIEPGAADGSRDAAVLTPSGEVTSLRAQWSPRGGDSVTVRLRRIGYSGSISFGPGAESRAGVAVSAAAPTALEEVVASSAPARARADSRRANAPAAAQSAPAAGPPVRQLRVTARNIDCPAR